MFKWISKVLDDFFRFATLTKPDYKYPIPSRTCGTFNTGTTSWNVTIDACLRNKRVELEAYYMAERDGFRQDPTLYWLRAEHKINLIDEAHVWKSHLESINWRYIYGGKL